SALVPILNESVEGTRVSIFNEQGLSKFPMLGLRFKNTTNYPLMQGPVAVFAEDSYAGDAIIADLQKGEERLLSYAVDLGAEVKTEYKVDPNPRIVVSLAKGIMRKTSTVRSTMTYTVKNRSEEDKLVILEHPVSPGAKLKSPAEPAKTQNF